MGRSSQPFHIPLGGCRMVQPSWKTVWQMLLRLNMYLHSGSPLTDISTTDVKISHKETDTQLFTAALLVIATSCKQPRRPSVGE